MDRIAIYILSLILFPAILIVKGKVSVSYRTSYPALEGDQYYVLNGTDLILDCAYSGRLDLLQWALNDKVILEWSPEIPSNTSYTSRSVISEETSGTHRLVIVVDKQDEGHRFKCLVQLYGSSSYSSAEVTINEILVPPVSVTSYIQADVVQCQVAGIYKGAEVTEFTVQIGSEHFTSGTKEQVEDTETSTYTVVYTQPVHNGYLHGQWVQCDVIWMQGTSVESAHKSVMSYGGDIPREKARRLGVVDDLQFPGTDVNLHISRTSLEEHSMTVITCNTSSNLSPTLELCRLKVSQTVEVLHSVNETVLTYMMMVEAADNGAEFYCKETNAGLESRKQTINVWFRPDGLLIDKTEPSIEGENSSISCSTIGTANPIPVLTVYFDDDAVYNVSGMVLTYNFTIQREHYGVQLTCIATSSDPEHLQYELTSGDRFYSVFFSTRNNVMNPEASDPVTPGQEKSITCDTGSANPANTMLWRKAGVEVTTGVGSQSTPGEYGGQRLGSSYTFTAQISDNGQVVSCIPVWQGTELTQHRQQVTIVVLYGSSFLLLSLQTTTEGEIASISCSSSSANPDPVLRVYQGGVTLGPGVLGLTLEYNVTVTRQMNRDEVYCSAISSDPDILEYEVESTTKLLNVTFPPDENTLNDEASNASESGTQKILSCRTGSADPISDMIWRRNGVDVTSQVISKTYSGDYYGQEMESVYNFTADISDNGVSVSCTPFWEGTELINLTRTVILDIMYTPDSVTLTMATDVLEHESQTIECISPVANPDRILTLYRSGTELAISLPGENVTHTVTVEREMNEDDVYCTATSSDESKLSYTITSNNEILNVTFGPLDNTMSADAEDDVSEGSIKTISCIITTALPVSDIIWRKGANEVTSGISYKEVSGEYGGVELHSNNIFTASRADNGVTVSCTPVWRRSELGIYMRTATIHVVYAPQVVNLTLDADVNEGVIITIQCTSTDAYPEPVLSFYKSGLQLGGSTTGLSITYDLNIQREMNEETIYCVATSSDVAKLDYTETSPETSLNVTFPPSLNSLSSGATESVEVGSEKILTCTTGSARPTSGMIWTKAGTVVSASDITSTPRTGAYGGLELESNYTFMAEQADDGVIVACTPTWQGVAFYNLTEEVVLEVTFPPVSVTLLLEPDATEKDHRVIECTCSDASPDPRLTLYKAGQQLGGSTTGQNLTHNLIIDREMNGQSIHCEATSSDTDKLDYTEYSTVETLNVTFPPNSNAITSGPEDTVEVGDTKVLTCSIGSARPVGDVVWRKGGTTVTSGVNTWDLMGEYGGIELWSSFNFTVEESDLGSTVSCTPVWNGQELGQYTGEVVLDVIYTPVSVLMTLIPDAMEAETRRVECSSSPANPMPVLTLYKSGVPLGNSVTGLLLVYNLLVTREMNEQSVYCEAVSSNPSKLNYAITSKPEDLNITFPPITNTMSPDAWEAVLAGTVKTLTCRAGSAHPFGHMIWRNGSADIEDNINAVTEPGDFGGDILESTYTFTAQVSDNGQKISCTPGWTNDTAELIAYRREVKLNVTYPPVITVQGPPPFIEESFELIITSVVEPGNPENLAVFRWEFEPKYPGTQSQALPGQRENRELRIQSAMYSDAGIYRCTAGNTVGSDTAEIQIVVHYSPQLYNKDDDPLIFYSDLDQSVTLEVTVRAFPDFTDIDSAFDWKRVDGKALSNITETESVKVDAEVFLTKVTIGNVTEQDLGEYVVTADNGIRGPVDFLVVLYLTGPPDPVDPLSIPARAATKAKMSWVVGLNGGSEQTFEVVMSDMVTGEVLAHQPGYRDPRIGSLLYYTLEHLTPLREYAVRVFSFNQNHGNNRAESELINFKTREHPSVNGDDLLYQINGSLVILGWSFEGYDSSYTSLIIIQCHKTGNCTHHNVTYNPNGMLVVQKSDGLDFHLVVYQDGLEAYRSQFAEKNPTVDGENSKSQIGLIIGVSAGLVLLLVAGIILAGYFFKRFKGSKVSPDKLVNHQKTAVVSPEKLQDTKNGLPPIKSQVDFDTFSINPEAHQYNRLAPLRLKSATQRRRAAMPALRPEVNPRNLTLNLGAKQYNRLQPIIPSGSGKESTA